MIKTGSLKNLFCDIMDSYQFFYYCKFINIQSKMSFNYQLKNHIDFSLHCLISWKYYWELFLKSGLYILRTAHKKNGE